jgi:hypothetical protein
VSGQTFCTGHFNARDTAVFGGWMGTGAGLGVLKKRKFSCSCQDFYLRSSSLYPGYFSDYDASYCFEDNTNFVLIKRNGSFGLGVFDS